VYTDEVARYCNNGLEQRVRKSGTTTAVTTGAVHYAYDEDGHVLGEHDTSGIPIYEVIWLGDQPVAVVKQTRTGSGTSLNVATRIDYVYADHLNTPRVVTRSSDHAIVWRWDSFECFGVTPANENPNALVTYSFNLRFPGQVYDRETTCFYNLNRDYAAWVGRYMQSDRIGLNGGINTYVYVDGNPVSYIDPWGWIRYNAPLPRTVPVVGETYKKLVCVETCLMGRTSNLSLDLLITGGAEKASHSPSSYHYKGEACDVSTSNPVSQDDMNNCAAS
jgi:RHS repeat-associated protein